MEKDQVLLEYFIANHPIEATRIIEKLSNDEITDLLKEVPDGLAVAIIELLERNRAAFCLQEMGVQASATILEEMKVSSAQLLLRLMKDNYRDKIFDNISENASAYLRSMLKYTPDCAGALMDPFVLTLFDDLSVKEAIVHLKGFSGKALPDIFVLKRDQTLAGVADLSELVKAVPGEPIQSLTNTNVPKVFARLNLTALKEHRGWVDHYALPVVDNSEIFLGAIRLETILVKSSDKRKVNQQVIETGSALGELYRIGLSGLIRSAGEGRLD